MTVFVSNAFAIGYDFHKSFGLNLRVEGEYLYHAKTDIKKTGDEYNYEFEDEIQSFNANVYYDFRQCICRNSSGFTPYIGAGIGLPVLM